jgi:UDP-2,3-diacylglucosamine hydrolase
MSSLLLLGDAHLRHGDPEVESFLSFLRSIPSDTAGLCLLGDLFDLWIGDPSFLTDSHRRIVGALGQLRGRGVRVVYVEGNRDYHLRRILSDGPFDEVAQRGTSLSFGTRKLRLSHGDLVNRADRPYRLWRALAKGPVLIRLFRALPRRAASRLAESLERRIARTNVRHRVRFPEGEVRAFARDCVRTGADTVVVGHFHQERRLVVEAPEGKAEVFVLPAWREGHRMLRIGSDGTAEFRASFDAGGSSA